MVDSRVKMHYEAIVISHAILRRVNLEFLLFQRDIGNEFVDYHYDQEEFSSGP